MTKEKIYQELTKALAVKGIDILALLKLQADIKADLLNEATTASKGGSKAKTAVINNILKEAKTFINCDESRIEKYKYMLNSLKVNDYQVFSTNYRFIATTEHTPHEIIDDQMIYSTYNRLINDCLGVPNQIVYLPELNELKAAVKIVKASKPAKNKNVIVCLNDVVNVNGDYLVDLMTWTGSREAKTTAENAKVCICSDDNKNIGVILPIYKYKASVKPDLFIDKDNQIIFTNETATA